MAHIDRSIVSIIFGRRIVTPRRIPVAAVHVIVAATDQLHAAVMRPVPALVVAFRMIRAKHFVLLALPTIASFNSITRIERDRRNHIRPRLRVEIYVLRLDLLHLLRIGLLGRELFVDRRV